jgi:hypothetical protein
MLLVYRLVGLSVGRLGRQWINLFSGCSVGWSIGLLVGRLVFSSRENNHNSETNHFNNNKNSL